MPRIVLWLTIVGLSFLCVLCAVHASSQIEREIEMAARDRLQAVGYDRVEVFAEGRDLTLAGSVSSERARARAVGMVSNLPAVRRVDHGRLSVLADSPSALGRMTSDRRSGGRLRISRQAERFVLDGVVGSERQRTNLLSEVAAVFGSDRVVDRLELRPDDENAVASYDLSGLWRVFGQAPPGAVIEVDAETIWLRGQIEGEVRAREFVARVAGVTSLDVVRAFEVVPEPNRERIQTELDRSLLGKTIEFERASDRISAAGRTTLEPIVRILRSAPGLTVEIIGHTDSEGLAERNLNLSRRRAEAVKRFLAERGVAAGRLVTLARGESQPIADNSTPEGRSKNRRIEFRVIGGS